MSTKLCDSRVMWTTNLQYKIEESYCFNQMNNKLIKTVLDLQL